MCYGLLPGVGKRQVGAFAAQSGCNFGCPPMVEQLWTLSGKSHYLHVLPGNSSPQAGSNGLQSGLLGGKTSGKTLRRVCFAGAVADLSSGKNALEKAVTVAVQRLLDSRNLGDIYASANDHKDKGTRLQQDRLKRWRESGRRSGESMWKGLSLANLKSKTREKA